MTRMSAKNRRKALYFIMKSQSGRCYFCDCKVFPSKVSKGTLDDNTATLDHIITKKEGGTNSYINLVVACNKCNGERGDQRFEDFLLQKYANGLEISYDTVTLKN